MLSKRTSSRWILGLLLALVCIDTVLGATDVTTLGKPCTSDDSCNAPYIICASDNKCAHKKLFPMTGVEIGSLFIMLIFLMVSIIVSIAGGVVIVPVASYLMGFNAKQAVALANAVVVLTCLVKYLMGLMKKNPEIPYKTIIDYNSALLMIPPMALFSTFGGIVVAFLPDVLILFMLVAIMIFAMVTGYFNLRRQINKERSVKHSATKPVKMTTQNEKDAPPTERQNMMPATETKKSDKLEVPETEHHALPLHTEADVLVADKPAMILGESPEIEAQKQVESSNFVWKKFSVILAVMVLSILVAIFRAGKGVPSVIGVGRCSVGDWMVLVVYILLMAFIPLYCAWIIFREQEHKTKIGWHKDSTEVHLDKSQYIFGSVWSAVSGALSTILGIGGGILLNPLLMRFQYMPVTASWTINLNTLLAKIAAIIIHVMAGDLLYDYVFFYGGIIVVGVIISENSILVLIKKTNSQLFYPVAFLIVIVICLVFVLFVGIDNWVTNSQKGIDVWKFQNYC